MTQRRQRKFFLWLFAPMALLLIAGIALYGDSEVEGELTRLQSQETLNVGLGAGALASVLESITRDLRFLSNHGTLKSAVDNPTSANLARLTNDLVNFSVSKGFYAQIRWLDESGMERARVDYRRGQPQVLATQELQNKGKRYYFADAFLLDAGEIFVSPLDLNVEQGEVEVPHKPMIRIATPVLDSRGSKRGIVLLNYNGADLLRRFTIAAANIGDHISLLNSDGYWLKSAKKEQEWGFMLGNPELTLGQSSPQAWRAVKSQNTGQTSFADGLWTWQTVYPLQAGHRSSDGAKSAFAPSRELVDSGQYAWKVVAHLSDDSLAAVTWGVWGKLFSVALLLLALTAYGSWKLAQAWAAQAEAEDEVRRINADLEKLVGKRTKQLRGKILELDDALAELRRKNEDMESMIYTVSHDLRSPLINIQGFCQRLEKSVDGVISRLSQEDVPPSITESLAKFVDERIPTALGFIRSGAMKMDALINGLLQLARAGRVKLHIEPLDMDIMLEQVLKDLTIQIHNAGGRITVDPLPPSLGDPVLISQVLTNIIDNAIKYREPSRPLEIRVRGWLEDGRACYEITDNGVGIPLEQQSKIWQLFHRLDPAGSVDGEGIGLTLVYRIVDRLRGDIRLDSVLGEGCRFTIELPVFEEAS